MERSMKPILVALNGPAGSGKSFCADKFIEMGFVRVKFAEALKDMLRDLLRHNGYTADRVEECIDGEFKETRLSDFFYQTPRQMMQGLGVWGRNIHPDFWVRLALNQANTLIDAGNSVIIDDCRYPNEAQAIRNNRHPGTTIFVKRPRLTRAPGEHLSEKPLPPELRDYTLYNSRDADFVAAQVRCLLRYMGETL